MWPLSLSRHLAEYSGDGCHPQNRLVFIVIALGGTMKKPQWNLMAGGFEPTTFRTQTYFLKHCPQQPAIWTFSVPTGPHYTWLWTIENKTTFWTQLLFYCRASGRSQWLDRLPLSEMFLSSLLNRSYGWSSTPDLKLPPNYGHNCWPTLMKHLMRITETLSCERETENTGWLVLIKVSRYRIDTRFGVWVFNWGIITKAFTDCSVCDEVLCGTAATNNKD